MKEIIKVFFDWVCSGCGVIIRNKNECKKCKIKLLEDK